MAVTNDASANNIGPFSGGKFEADQIYNTTGDILFGQTGIVLLEVFTVFNSKIAQLHLQMSRPPKMW